MAFWWKAKWMGAVVTGGGEERQPSEPYLMAIFYEKYLHIVTAKKRCSGATLSLFF